MDNLAADFEINPNNPLNAEYELGEGVGFDCSFELFASGTVWGSIDGDINNQTDLINLLNTKVDLTSFEELSQTVTNNYNELSGDIADLTTTVTDNYNTLSGQISDLTTTVNDNYTSLDNRLTTAEGSILNLTDTVNDNYTELNGKITTANNNLSTLSQTVEDNNTAINNRIDGIVDSFDGDISDLNDAIDNLSDTVSDNYTDLDGKITDNTDDITTIQNTINSYGDIVSYDAAYFATANQGALADTALQPNDNISELVNDVGYITSASLPTVNNATITIQKNGADVGTFTLNQANNDTLNITVPTQASDIGAMPDTTTIGDLTTTAQLNALNSGATTSNIGQITTNQNNIADIRSLIPLQASTSNQLADKSFVNSSIATNTANFIGTFNSVAELEAYSGTLTNNDYAFVATTDSAGNTLYDRYKYNADTQEWLFEYELNNSSFTAQQWASINSGITSGDVTLIGTALQPNDNISELINDAGYITSASLPTVNNGTLDIQVNGTSIGTFTANQSGNTTANIVVPDSATWGNITGTLSNQIDLQTALDAKQNTISDLSTIRSGASLGATALQPNDNITELVNNAGYITGITSSDVTTALGYTPYNSTNPSGYITSSDLPIVNNGTLTIQKNGTTVGTFTANQSTDSTINIEADTVLTDDTTVNKNSDDELQAIGVIDDNLKNAYNFTVVGSPTITNDGVASGFEFSDYITIANLLIGATKYSIKVKFTLPSTILGYGYVFADDSGTNGLSIYYDSNNVIVRCALQTTVNSIGSSTANSVWEVEVIYDNGTAIVNYTKNGVSGTKTLNTTGYTDFQATNLFIGQRNGNDKGTAYFKGSIDLKQFSITVDGVEVYRAWQPPALKYWTGTRTQYDAIVTKDANTLYNVEDTTSPIISILDSLYPIGSIYIGTMSACPLQTLGIGTWQLVATDKVLQGAGTRGSVGTTINESLPNITGNVSSPKQLTANYNLSTANGAFSSGGQYGASNSIILPSTTSVSYQALVNFNAHNSNATYQDNAPVQQDAYLVNIWERIS